MIKVGVVPEMVLIHFNEKHFNLFVNKDHLLAKYRVIDVEYVAKDANKAKKKEIDTFVINPRDRADVVEKEKKMLKKS